MPHNQRARVNWLDRIVLVAAAVIIVAAVVMRQQSIELKREVRTSRAISCAGQRAVTSSTVPACRSVARLAQDR